MKARIAAARLSSIALAAVLLAPAIASAQNITIVNGKPVPKARVETLMNQITKQGGQPRTPELEQQVKDEVVLREIFVQEAEKRGLPASASYREQMELLRQTVLIRELFADYEKKNPVTDADIKAEYDKFKAQAGDAKEYHTRHILVEKEEDAKSLITQIKGGASFEELAKKNSKDPGSAPNGGDLDWSPANAYVPEFSQAMAKLAKGQMTDAPVKTSFGWHIIKVEDIRDVQLPTVEEVTPQIKQRLTQQKLAAFRDELKTKAKTDYKFGS
ncbi:peptidylprolyl isomerase [Caldimonas sp. KR1-144]|uniref:peptidylprolyl isomerase n=1 Tax=Caldimonas sp. KR1-144 TaxID=3400911 RepID=UPI003C075D54